MQEANRRVKTIYSVIASSNRLEILRILNTKGPLSYSELKTLAGFKSKKESGKFAYHLRKLVRQMLISLNRSERKYAATNLGRLVLNLTRQIEEQSVIESGKIYVRTSRHTMEEFNVDRITQSLVKEAGMPLELAQKITSEAESRLYKFQTTYLTAPLIREIVNALLIEHGYEEYRHKMTRLGLPVYDVNELLNRVVSTSEGVEAVMTQTAHSVFTEYLLLNQLPKDVADLHLAGDIHIANAGRWGLMPDTLFVDLLNLQTGGINLSEKMFAIPRIGAPTKLSEATSALVALMSLLSKECSVEISCQGLLSYFAKFLDGTTDEELEETLRRTFNLVSLAVGGYGRPVVSFNLGDSSYVENGVDEKLVKRVEAAALQAYRNSIEATPMPRIKLIVSNGFKKDEDNLVKEIATITNLGGSVAVCTKPNAAYSYAGLRRNSLFSDTASNTTVVLHALSLNLPRLSRESNGDEMYFRAKLALLLRVSVRAMAARKRMVRDALKKGLLAVLSGNPNLVPTDDITPTINLVGLREAAVGLLGERAASSGLWSTYERIVETAVKVASEKADERACVAVLSEEGASRLAALDADRYGKVADMAGQAAGYTQSYVIGVEELSNEATVKGMNALAQKLNGGCSIHVRVPRNMSLEDLSNVIKAGSRLECFKLSKETFVCRNCGAKTANQIAKCRVCRSSAITTYPTA